MKLSSIPYYISIFLLWLSIILLVWGGESYESRAYVYAVLSILNHVGYKILNKKSL